MTAHRGIKLAVMWSDPAFVHWSDKCSPDHDTHELLDHVRPLLT